MKFSLQFIILFALLFSCNPEAKKVTEGLLKEVEKIEKDGVTTHTEIEKLQEELIKKTPLTEEELLRAFPKELTGLALDKVSAIPGMGQVVGQFGNRKISLSIADAAGEKNALATVFIGNYSFVNPSTENRKFSNIERDGIKTVSDYNAYDKETEMWLLYDNRYYISLSGTDMNPEELWQAFDINALKGYKEMNK